MTHTALFSFVSGLLLFEGSSISPVEREFFHIEDIHFLPFGNIFRLKDPLVEGSTKPSMRTKISAILHSKIFKFLQRVQ